MKFLLLFIFPLLAFAEMEGSRLNMIKVLKNYGIKDNTILKVMEKIPRHLFVPEHLKGIAYTDRPLPIGLGQTISQPYIVAYMSEMLKVNKTMRVLEIGTGSGYQAAVLGEIAGSVYTIEIVKGLCKRSSRLLKKLNYKNVKTKCGDGYAGWPKWAPFDRIILTAAPPKIPKPLIDQLAPNGILIAPVGTGYQHLVQIIKGPKGKVMRKKLLPVRFVPMTGKAQDE